MPRLFQAIKGSPDSRYDAVVMGAGVGGLTCANLLAKAGLKTLLVEQHYMVGGYCSTFKRGGYTFDAATHFYPLLGNPSTHAGRLLQDLGVGTRWVKMNPVDRFHLPDGEVFAIPADFQQYLALLESRFPEERTGLRAFFDDVTRAYKLGLLRYFRSARPKGFEAYESVTLREAIDRRINDPRLKLVLTGDCPHWGSSPRRTSFVFDSMLRMSYFLGNYYPEGGSQAFADELARTFESRGGNILMRARALKIRVSEGRVRGVTLEHGRSADRRIDEVDADFVISNADMRLTLEQLLGPEHVPAETLRSFQQMRPTFPCFLTHIGLRDFELAELIEQEGYHWSSLDPEQLGTEVFKIFVPTQYEPRMAPRGGQVLIVQKPLPLDDYDAADHDQIRKDVQLWVLERLEGLFPRLRGRIVHLSSASAATSQRYTLNFQGAMLGWEMSPDQLGDCRPVLDDLPQGLYFAGHWAQPGGGITPVIVSAVRAAEAITRERQAAPELSS